MDGAGAGRIAFVLDWGPPVDGAFIAVSAPVNSRLIGVDMPPGSGVITVASAAVVAVAPTEGECGRLSLLTEFRRYLLAAAVPFIDTEPPRLTLFPATIATLFRRLHKAAAVPVRLSMFLETSSCDWNTLLVALTALDVVPTVFHCSTIFGSLDLERVRVSGVFCFSVIGLTLEPETAVGVTLPEVE